MSRAQIQKRAAILTGGVVGIASLFGAIQSMVKLYQENRNLFVLILIGFFLSLLWATSGYVYFAHTRSKTRKSKPKYSHKRRITSLVILISSLLLTVATFLSSSVRSYIGVALNGSPLACPYTEVAKTDDAAIQWLIQQEAQAVKEGNITQIQKIFSTSALIVDFFDKNNPTQYEALDRYQTLFANAKYVNPINRNIKALVVTGDTAYYISGSQGKIMWTNGQTTSYNNLDNANHWTLRKLDGCWKIVEFDFNASDIPFPVNVRVP